MTQHAYTIADTNGLAFLADVNAALAAIVTNNSGTTEPAETFPHMWWADTTAGVLKRRNAADDGWIPVMSLSLAITTYMETVLGAANAASARALINALSSSGGDLSGGLNECRTTVDSHATTADIWAALGNSINWTGTATTTTFPAAPQAGAKRRLHCAAACSFTHSATLDIVGNANFIAEAGDIVDVEAVTTTTFRLMPIKDDGTPISISAPLFIKVRQSIQYGPTTGTPAVSNLIPQSQIGATLATGVTAKFSTKPTLLSIANGFNADGSDSNVNVLLNSDMTLTGLAASATNVIAYDKTNNVLVKTTVLDTDTKGGTPAITNGLYTLDYENWILYLGNGTVANPVQHIILAEVDTNGTVVTAIRCRAYRGYADTGWFAVATSQLYIKNHNVGTINCDLDLVWNGTATDSGARNVPQYPISGGSAGSARAINKNIATFGTYDGFTYSSTAPLDTVTSAAGFYRATMTRKY